MTLTPSPPPACSSSRTRSSSASNPTNTALEWVNITGNIHNLQYSIFGQTYDPTTDPNSIKLNQAIDLTSIVADWRYTIPNNATDPMVRGSTRCCTSAATRACTSRSTMA